MITPIELQSKNFKTGIGYDKRDVDNFLNELLKGYEITYKENLELNDKVSTLNEGINYYKSIEKTLQKALVLAEQTAEETKSGAKLEAKGIIEEARGKAQILLAEASSEVNRIQQQTIQLIRQYESYKAQFKHLAAAQCELLESESFNIHIADLDMFIEKTPNFKNSEDNKTGINNMDSSNVEGNTEYLKSTLGGDVNNSDKTQEEDFEFYNLSDE